MLFFGVGGAAFLFVVVVTTILFFLWRCIALLRRFTCGSTIDDVIEVAKEYNQKGIRVLINYSPEAARTTEEGLVVCNVYNRLLDRMAAEHIAGGLSVKPSSLVGRARTEKERQMFRVRIHNLATHANDRWVWIDEESAQDATFFSGVLRSLVFGRKNFGLVIRAYRKDSFEKAKMYAEWHKKGASFRVRVCRGAYPRDAQHPREVTEGEFRQIHRYLSGYRVSVVAATHTLVNDIRHHGNSPLPAIHMLHGRDEIKTILEPLVRENKLSDAAVYLIFGPLGGRIWYGLRRIREKPSLLWGA